MAARRGAMTICDSCGAAVPRDYMACPECGNDMEDEPGGFVQEDGDEGFDSDGIPSPGHGPLAFDCPNCGEPVPRGALACPACGADDETGWGSDAELRSLDLPDGYAGEEEPSRPWKNKIRIAAALLALLAALLWIIFW